MSKRRGNNDGSVYQRKSDQRWVVSITTGHTAQGKPKRTVVYCATRREATKKLAELQHAREAGLSTDGTRISVARHLDDWLTSTVALRVRASTLYSYRNYVRWYLLPHLGSIMLAKLRQEDVQAAWGRLLAEGRAPRTVVRARAILVMALTDAVERGLVMRNVAALTSGPRLERHEHITLVPTQARALLAAAADTPYEALIHLALLLGLRRGELQALRWQDVDLQRDELHVVRTITRAPGAPIYAEPKTRAGRRIIPLSPLLGDLLTRQWQRVVDLRRAAAVAWHDEDLVFPSADGTPMPATTLHCAFKHLLKVAALPDIRLHDLRHACASLLADEGVAPRTAMEILGHSNIAVTLEVYTRALDTSKREAIDAMDRLLIGRPETDS